MPSGEKRSRWLCECDCGNEISVIGKSLIRKNGTKSCGCFARENMSKIKKRYNTYDLTGEFGIGYTSKNEEFWFDLEDYENIKDYCWYKTDQGYIASKESITRKTVFLHRIVTNCPDGLMVDHIHGNNTKHDNKKSNLRVCTNQENCMNCSLPKNNTSGVTGVKWHSRDNVWESCITVNYKRIYLGRYDKFEDAVKSRKEAEEKYFGKFSYDNSQVI